MEIHIVWVEFLSYISLKLKVYVLYVVISHWDMVGHTMSHKPFTAVTSFASMYDLFFNR